MANPVFMVIALALNLLFAGPTISEESLLREYVDLSRLCGPAAPSYVSKQASSYDRASTEPGNDAWFGNADYGQYLRIENVDGRTERVMLDAAGPGAVMTIWSANPAGTIRFYVDGATQPALVAPVGELLGGKTPGFPAPFAYESSRGWNLYYPFPFQKSMKITAEGAGTEGMYYHVDYRQYPASVTVQSFDPALRAPQITAARALEARPKRPQLTKAVRIAPNEGRSIVMSAGAGTVRSLAVRVDLADNVNAPWTDPKRIHNALRKLRLTGWTDGGVCIDVPLGDFFGAAPGINPYQSLPMSVFNDGTMVCRFPMPFNRSIDLTIVNANAFPVKIAYAAQVDHLKAPLPRYVFKAQWLSYLGGSQPKRDMEMLHAKGEGTLVGSALFIENSRAEWWGEGDEKIAVDGEPFPSWFGTGTEDFYGYAWCWPHVFERPFHAQPRVDGPGNFGHTSVNRWFIADAVPFSKSLQFDLELWHWADCQVKFSRVSYWYAKPGGTPPAEVNAKLLIPAELVANNKVKGAIEGEKIKVVSRSGGQLENQGGFMDLSSGEQLWWTHMKPGDSLVLEVPTALKGRFRVIGSFCRNVDYGRHRITIDDVTKEFDFYDSKLHWEKFEIGEVQAKNGKVTIRIDALEKNAAATDGNMFGLDYLLFEPVP